MEYSLKIKRFKTPTDANWVTTISGGYMDIKGRVYDFSKASDARKKADGTISNPFDDEGGYWKANAELTGLINPFTNPISNAAVTETRIEVSFTDTRGWGSQIPGDNYFEYVGRSAITKIEKRYKELYGVEIDLSFVKIPDPPKEEPAVTAPITASASGPSASTTTTTTEIAAATSSTTGASASGASASNIDGEFTFNVEQESLFIGNNNQFGTLSIIGIGEIKDESIDKPVDEELPIGVEDEVIDEEYGEEAFSGEEEAALILQKGNEFTVIDSESTNSIKGIDPENPDPALSTNSDAKYPVSKNTDGNIKKIIEVAKKSGVTNKYAIAAMLAICKKECGLVPQNEGSYSGTGAARIKKIFSKFRKYSDSEVDRIKKNHKEFFDIIYGAKYGNAADEGYKYRGRGLNQITFKGNYIKYKGLSGHDIVGDPDLLNKIDVAAKCLVEYFKANIKSAPASIESKYNFSDINSFKNLDDAIGAMYHANAGWGKGYNEIVADSTGGRAKAFKYVGPLYNTYLKG